MIGSYLAFAREHWRHLAFGMLLMGLSSFGQTFFISLFGGKLRGAYHLSDAGLGTAYAIATFASAFTLSWVGRLMTASACSYTRSPLRCCSAPRAFAWPQAARCRCWS